MDSWRWGITKKLFESPGKTKEFGGRAQPTPRGWEWEILGKRGVRSEERRKGGKMNFGIEVVEKRTMEAWRLRRRKKKLNGG